MNLKIYLIASLFFSLLINGQTINIPNLAFKNFLTRQTHPHNFGVGWYNEAPTSYTVLDTNNDGEIQQNEVANITYLNLLDLNLSNITGIEYFISLKSLDASGNPIGSINLASLTQLEF